MAAAVALFLWFGSIFLLGTVQPGRERACIEAAILGERPRDGERTAVVGRIEALGQPLRAPLSGADCVAYRYEICRFHSDGENSRWTVYYEGVAIAPSTIKTLTGSHRLFAVPDFDFPGESLNREMTLRNAQELVRRPDLPAPSTDSLKPGQWTDDRGAFRWERRSTAGEIDLSACFFSEHFLKQGDNVCAVGVFSSARTGLVPSADRAKPARLMKGDAQAISRQLSRRISRYFVGGVASYAIAAAIAGFFLFHRGLI